MSPPATTTVTAIVPTWRRTDDLVRCIDGLGCQTVAPKEVLVVAREDDVETWAVLERLQAERRQPAVRAVPVVAPGVVASLNAGLDAAQGDVVAITDDDSIPSPDWIERLLATFDSRPDAGGVGGRDRVHVEGHVLEGSEEQVGEIRWFGRVVGNHHIGAGAAREVEVLKGVNMAFRRAALAGARLDPGLRGRGTQTYWEIGICLAVRRAGWTLIYDPAIVVDHHPAPRLDQPQRHEASRALRADDVFNHTLGLLTGLTGARKAVALLFWLLVGGRHSPGLASAIERRLRGEPVWAELWALTSARLAATRLYVGRRLGR